MKPLVSYYGGKQRIAKKIASELSIIPHSIYAEPYAGGLAVLYAKSPPVVSAKANYVEAINDTNEMLMTLYRVARSSPDEFWELIQWTPYSKAELNKSLKIYNGIEQANDIEKAWAVFVACHFSFSNEIGAGWKVGRIGQNVAYKWALVKQRLKTALERLSQVHIDCVDALTFIKRWDTPNTLFYCDPPYPGACQGHYGGYKLADFERLCSALDSAQGSYVMSNYDQGKVRPATAQREIKIQTKCTATGSGRVRGRNDKAADQSRTEILWICDRSPEQCFQQSFDLRAIV